jgi:hypothetical protein
MAFSREETQAETICPSASMAQAVTWRGFRLGSYLTIKSRWASLKRTTLEG